MKFYLSARLVFLHDQVPFASSKQALPHRAYSDVYKRQTQHTAWLTPRYDNKGSIKHLSVFDLSLIHICKKPDNFLGARTYEIFLFINGSLGVILIGMAVSTFFSGSDFVLNEHNFVEWKTPFRGLEALANPYLYLLGIAMFFLSRIGGCLYLMNNIADGEFIQNARKQLLINTVLFLPFFLGFLAWVLTKDGFAYDANGVVSLMPYKYAINLIEMPIVGILLLVGVVLVLVGIFQGAFTKSIRGIFAYGVGVTLAVTALFLITGLNGTAFYPSFSDLASSLTIKNASSSHYTLGVDVYKRQQPLPRSALSCNAVVSVGVSVPTSETLLRL